MSKKNSIKMNYIYNSLYQLLLMITPLITSPYVSRILGSDGLGVYSYTSSMANCFALAGMLGITNYGNRSIATVQNDKIARSKVFWNIFSVQLMSTLIVLIIYLVYISALCQKEYRLVSFIQIMTVFCSFCDINWYFFGVEKFKLTVTRNIIIKIINILLIFLLVRDRSDVVIYTAIISGSMLASNIVIWPFMMKEVYFARPSVKDMLPHIWQILVLFVPVIAITLYKRMDKIMLGMMSGMSQTGFYENAEKIISIPNSLIAALGTVMLPRMSNLFANNKAEEAGRYLKMSMEFVCLMASALMFGIAGIAVDFAPLFFGEEFSEAGYLIMALSPTVFVISWANVIRTQYLIPLHYDKIYVVSVWIGAIVNLIINTMLIPLFGALGAVIGTVAAELAVMLCQTFSVKDKLPIKEYWHGSLFYFFTGFIMFLVVKAVSMICERGAVRLLFEIVIGGMIYLLITIPHIRKKYFLKITDAKFYIKGLKDNGISK